MSKLRLILPVCLLIFLNASCEKNEWGRNGSISGRVVDEVTGKGVQGVYIGINIENRQMLTDRKGCFEFHGVPTDRPYLLQVLIDKEPYFTRLHEVEVRMKGRKNVVLENILAGHGGAIEGMIKRWDGTPVPSMSVTVYAEDENPGVYGGVPDKYGHYRVPKLPPDTELRVVACCWNVSEGCGRVVKEGVLVKKDEITKRVDLIVPYNPTQISGKVKFRDGTPLQAHLTFWKGPEEMGNLCCDKGGNFSISALEAGNYKIHVGYGDEKKRIHRTG
ncbi:MAG: carboxypeptidase regulatory-like domain-containing protein, partial [Candidatus Aminicenantes bacterium]|nr:carboxypeptidase regulatory-like domain-containing protein [Candidatus Aminicenantes bacterium]